MELGSDKALWRALKLETLVWAHMYDDTVTMAKGNVGTLSLVRMCSPRLEPEIVFKLRAPIEAADADPGATLRSVEWLALGFEIVDSIFADWTFQPPDFVAAYGLHAALVVGNPHPVDAASIPALVDQLSAFRVRLLRNGSPTVEGSGRNCLRSPAVCLGVLAAAVATRTPEEPLAASELRSLRHQRFAPSGPDAGAVDEATGEHRRSWLLGAPRHHRRLCYEHLRRDRHAWPTTLGPFSSRSAARQTR